MLNPVSVLDRQAVCVSKTAGNKHDEIDHPPDSHSSECHQHQQSCADLSDIEPVDTKSPQEKAEKNSRNKVLVALLHFRHSIHLSISGQGSKPVFLAHHEMSR